jgi:lactoylglutathione lyase
MPTRAFPILYAADVEASAAFYESLGFNRHFQLPPDGPAGYVGLRDGATEMAIVAEQWPLDHYGTPRGPGPTFEMFVYVDDADATFADLLGRGATAIEPPSDMPWGERVGFVRDPDGNPVAVATQAT